MWRACSSRQQRRCGCGSKQRACVRQQAAAAGGTIAIDGRQPACVRQRAAVAACMQQHAAVAACVRQRAVALCVCGSRRGQPAARLQWETVMAAANRRHNCNGRQWQRHKGWRDSGKIAMDNGDGDGQLWVKVGVGGRSG